MSEGYRGGWVFKDGSELYGPVSTEFLIGKLERGEIGPETLVSKESGQFAPLGTFEPFVEAAARAAAAKLLRSSEAARRRRIRRLSLGGVVVLAAGFLLISFARNDPSGNLDLAEIHIEALPLEVRAVLVGREEDGMEEYLEDEPPPVRSAPKRSAIASRAPSPPPSPDAPPNEVSIETRYDEAAIGRVVQSRRGELLPCILRQAEADPTLRGELPISFVVGADGRVSRLWIDRAGHRRGPMYDCILANLRSWSFPPFEGQSPAISLSFLVGG